MKMKLAARATPPQLLAGGLEMEAYGARECPRRQVVRPAERRKKIVEGVLVCQIDHFQTRTPLIAVVVKEVVIADREIEHMPR